MIIKNAARAVLNMTIPFAFETAPVTRCSYCELILFPCNNLNYSRLHINTLSCIISRSSAVYAFVQITCLLGTTYNIYYHTTYFLQSLHLQNVAKMQSNCVISLSGINFEV